MWEAFDGDQPFDWTSRNAIAAFSWFRDAEFVIEIHVMGADPVATFYGLPGESGMSKKLTGDSLRDVRIIRHMMENGPDDYMRNHRSVIWR